MPDFKSGKYDCRTGKLDTFDQLLLVKRIGWAIRDSLILGLLGIAKEEDKQDPGEQRLRFFASFLEVARRIPDEDIRFVMDKTLSAAFVKQGKVWSPVMKDGVLMFSDLSAASQLQICHAVLEANLGNFFEELRLILVPKAETPEK